MNILLCDKFKIFDFKDFHHIVKICQSFVTNSTINHLVIQSVFKKDNLFYNRILRKFDVIEGTKVEICYTSILNVSHGSNIMCWLCVCIVV
jgi:hypothetical protein